MFCFEEKADCRRNEVILMIKEFTETNVFVSRSLTHQVYLSFFKATFYLNLEYGIYPFLNNSNGGELTFLWIQSNSIYNPVENIHKLISRRIRKKADRGAVRLQQSVNRWWLPWNSEFWPCTRRLWVQKVKKADQNPTLRESKHHRHLRLSCAKLLWV